MARWTQDLTAAAMSTRKLNKRVRGSKPWQHHRSSDFSMWLVCGSIILGSTFIWCITNLTDSPSRDFPPHEPDTHMLEASNESEDSSVDVKGKNEESAQSHFDDQETSLLWWIESAPLPDPQMLTQCLDQPQRPLPQVMVQKQGLSVLLSGRPQPQTVYEREEKIWVKTPLLGSPHQQSYDHLVLISCLQTPGATLYDPLLVRQWGGDTWPKRDPQTNGVALEDLFVIRSNGEQHHTYGLHRLGLPELGLMTSSDEGRTYLQRFALYWILQPGSRESLQKTDVEFTLQKNRLKVINGELFNQWAGDASVKVIVDIDHGALSSKTLDKLFKAPKETLKKKQTVQKRVLKKHKNQRKPKRKKPVQRKKLPLLEYR